MRIMSLAGFIAPEEWSKLSHATHRKNLHKSKQDCQNSILSQPDTLCPKMLYLSENKMCGKAKIMKL